MLPRIDRMLAGGDFRPRDEPAHFRLVGTDFAAHSIVVPLAKHFLSAGNDLSFDIVPLTDGAFDTMDRGRIDLLLHADDGNVPSHLCREVLFEEDFVYVIAKNSSHSDHPTLEQYLEARHVMWRSWMDCKMIYERLYHSIREQVQDCVALFVAETSATSSFQEPCSKQVWRTPIPRELQGSFLLGGLDRSCLILCLLY